VATKRWILFLAAALLAATMLAVLAGCSGGSTANVQNPPPPPQSQVTIAFQTEPGPSLAVSFSENLTATVTNDPSNLGVEWSVVCPASVGVGNCGTVCASANAGCSTAVAQTASCPTPPTQACTAIYTAPATISTGSMSVQIVAYALANEAANQVAPVTITTFDGNLPAGNYVLQAQGVDTNFNPYQVAAVITLDGQGNVTAGEQTANYLATGSLSDPINAIGSSYFVGSDGRGMITLSTNDSRIGNDGSGNGNGVETFALVFLNNGNINPQALISQVDIGIASTGSSASGTLDLQASSPAPPLGGYAFVVNGTDVVKTNPTSGVNLPVAFGGVFNIDSANKISGNGSVVDEVVGKKVTATALRLSGTLTEPDQFGGFTLNLSVPFGVGNKAIALQFTGYIVDSAHIKLIETDTATGGVTTPFGLTAGPAIGQGTATGSFTADVSLSGTYVFNTPGVDLSQLNSGVTLPSTLTSVGIFTADGSGNLNNGFTDTFLLQNCAQLTCIDQGISGAQISSTFSGNYSVDSSGTGRGSLTVSNFNPNPKGGYTPTLLFYLAGNGNPTLMLEGGSTAYPSIGTGVAYAQSGASTFGGSNGLDYGLSFTQEDSSENDGTGQLNANSPAQTLSGFADSSVNVGSPGLPDQSFGGTFNSPTSNIPFAGTLANTNDNTAFTLGNYLTNQFAVDYYIIDPDHGFFVETDLVNSVPPADPANPSGQVSFGYYAARTPLCAGCP
jgi:hypothetical protein